MKNKKIKLLIERGGMRSIESTIAIVENTLDENYKLVKSEKVEVLHTIHFNYEWINKEKDQLFFEVSTKNVQTVKNSCQDLQKKLNLAAL